MSDDAVLLVSADCHAGAPVAAYRDYVDPGMREEYEDFLVARAEWVAERNRTMGLADDAELVHALFGEDMVDNYEGDEAVSGGGANGVWDSARRQAELEPEGIVAEVLFPDFQNSNEPPWGAAFPFPDTDNRRRLAGARIYNRWLADFCKELPGRRAGLAIVQPHDIDAAVAEARWARDAGLAGIMLPTGDVGLPSYHDRRYDPLWSVCCDLGLPVTVHSGGTPWEGQGLEAMWVTKYEFLWWSHRPLWQIILGGVFERFPSMQLVFTEQGADWIPAVLSRLDEQYASPFERQITDVLRQSPTGYWRSNCYVGASFMSWGESLIRDQLGIDRIMWGSDYPHIEGTWPRSHAALKEALNGCTEPEVRMMVGETAARVYGFDVDALRPLAEKIGPRIEDLLTEEREPPVRYDPVDYALGRVSTRETTRRLMATLGRT